jgi:amino acid transporter
MAKSALPTAAKASFWTISVYVSFLVWMVPVLPPYAPELSASSRPLFETLLSSTGATFTGWEMQVLLLVINIPMQFLVAAASLFTCSRYTYTLSRGGLLPLTLSLTYDNVFGKENIVETDIKTQRSTVALASRVGTHSSTVELPSSMDNSNLMAPKSIERKSFSQLPNSTTVLSVPATTNSTEAGKQALIKPRTPIYAVIFACFVAFLLNVVVYYAVNGDDSSSDDLLRMSAWISCVCYSLQMISYCKLRYSMKTLPRPSPSPLGVAGAAMALFVSLVFGILAPFALPSQAYWKSTLVLGMFSVVFLLYFFLYAKPRLTKSPEQLFIQCVVNFANLLYPKELKEPLLDPIQFPIPGYHPP